MNAAPAPAAVTCDLCGLDCGRHPVECGARRFCCPGCRHVYAILEESGVIARGGDFRDTEVFRQSQRLGLISRPAAPAPAPAVPADAEQREILYHVGGLWCTSCGWLIEHALLREPGVTAAEVMFASDLLKVRYAPQYAAPTRIPERVAALGYSATVFDPSRDPSGAERRDLLLRLGIAAFLWMNVMTFSLVIYTSYFEGIAETARRGIPFVLMGLTLPAILYSARPILRAAWGGLREGVLRMEALVSVGILAAFFYSAIQAFRGGQHYYFDTACAIITLVLAGKALERGAKERAARSIASLYRMMPTKARRWENALEKFVAADAVEPGMTLLVKPGERIPADGVVLEGASSADEAVLTGESLPREKAPGSEVIAGSLNGAGPLVIRVTGAGANSTLARMIHNVEAALASKTPLERAVDRISRLFAPAVMLVAGATGSLGVLAGLDFDTALLRAIAVLVIACPCALGIATPLATTAAIGAASRRGILIRDARVLETLPCIDTVILDKTGTATEGAFRVREEILLREDAPALAAALERFSQHPIAQAILAHAPAPQDNARNVTVEKGLGLAGDVGPRRVAVGSALLLPAAAERFREQARAWEQQGWTVVYCAVDGEPAAAWALGDEPRAGARQLIDALRARGVRTILLSGDSPATTAAIAARLGADDQRGGVLPLEKAAAVREAQLGGRRVAMVGDGVNDAPALAAADLGIALGSGAALALETAPVVLMHPALGRIAEVVDLARRTLRIVHQNLFWAFAYNTVGIALAITGVLNPILAAGAMVLSSVSVIANSRRLQKPARDEAGCVPPPEETWGGQWDSNP